MDKVKLAFVDATGTVKAAVTAEIADTPETRRAGLSNRSDLPDGTGMFFDKVGAYWMKDVNFPLDILFLNEKGVVLEKQSMLVDNGTHDVLRHLYIPEFDTAAHALELPLGWFNKSGLAVGDKVKVAE